MSEYSVADVSKHNNPHDAWIIFNGKVYDVTNYVIEHPGGDIILRHAGKDATLAIENKAAHQVVKSFIRERIAKLHVGDLKEESEEAEKKGEVKEEALATGDKKEEATNAAEKKEESEPPADKQENHKEEDATNITDKLSSLSIGQ
ncbi:PREDICTED: cytochrome b5-like isoform X2 [Priapulus caudatus]|uniref:Cytochrome b5-like isoform X2 n=1 Tax=Priapulus caudatus TaxID=37621 RepID=A0ABM1E5Z6_PRICU|nr:PREDICTED: cytochrome b5-like isoform X2 [Priapulus caudatus]